MKIESYDDRRGNEVLTGMIVSSQVLGKIAARWKDGGLFPSKWANIVGQLCVDYHNRHGKAPRRSVRSLFESWAVKRRDSATVQLVETYLAQLSAAYEQQSRVNGAHVLDVAQAYFTDVRLGKMLAVVKGHMDAGKQAEALETVASFARVDIGGSATVDVLESREELANALSQEEDEDIVTYDGGAGEFFRHALEREGLIAFCGPEKRGKTWWLVDMACRAVAQRRRVFFFEVGDMPKKRVYQRFAARFAAWPVRSSSGWPFTVEVPKSWDGKAPKCKLKTFDKPLAVERAWDAFVGFKENRLKSDKVFFKMQVHPASCCSVRDIRNAVADEARNGWAADVIVIDYADILAAPYGRLEGRDKIDRVWQDLSALRQEAHALVVTATQAKRTAYNREEHKVLTMEDISEDKRKLGHATGVIGINVSDAEKKAGRTRINWMALREKEFSPYRVCYTAGCLALANPCMISLYPPLED